MGRCDPYNYRDCTPDCSSVCDELLTRLETFLGPIDDDDDSEGSSKRFHQRMLDALDSVELSFAPIRRNSDG